MARYTAGFMVDPWGNDERKVASVFEGQVSVPANRPLTDASQETTVFPFIIRYYICIYKESFVFTYSTRDGYYLHDWLHSK